MANQVRIEYDPYQQKASYQIRDSSNRKFAKIPKSDLGNPDNLMLALPFKYIQIGKWEDKIYSSKMGCQWLWI